MGPRRQPGPDPLRPGNVLQSADVDPARWPRPRSRRAGLRSLERSGAAETAGPATSLRWHWIYDDGNGDLGNQGIHEMDLARWFLGYSAVSPRMMSIGGRLGYDDDAETPNTQLVYSRLRRPARCCSRSAACQGPAVQSGRPRSGNMDLPPGFAGPRGIGVTVVSARAAGWSSRGAARPCLPPMPPQGCEAIRGQIAGNALAATRFEGLKDHLARERRGPPATDHAGGMAHDGPGFGAVRRSRCGQRAAASAVPQAVRGARGGVTRYSPDGGGTSATKALQTKG